MRFNDAAIGLFLVIFAIAEIAYTGTFPSLLGQAYGPDLFPRIIGAGLFGCGLLLMIRGLMQRARGPGDPASEGYAWLSLGRWAREGRTIIDVMLVVVCPLAYILLSEWLGFILMSLLILSVLMIRFGTSVPVALACAALCTAVIQVVFARVLLVPLPVGLLQPLFF